MVADGIKRTPTQQSHNRLQRVCLHLVKNWLQAAHEFVDCVGLLVPRHQVHKQRQQTHTNQVNQTDGLDAVLAEEDGGPGEENEAQKCQKQLDESFVGEEEGHGDVVELPLLLDTYPLVPNRLGNLFVLPMSLLQVHHESSARQGSNQR